ncbi:MAG: TfoX/Sxy family protein [Verrucomicrobia bacterium]|nr:TfoX/Sxy family protein [Verrucomicrobiota bacterium]
MANASFKAFVLDQLRSLPDVWAKAMFGGYGLYRADRFFGILMEGRLYFRTNEKTRPAYVKRGMGPFVYQKAKRTNPINYYEVAADVLERSDDLIIWANRAIAVAAAGREKHRPRRRKSLPSGPKIRVRQAARQLNQNNQPWHNRCGQGASLRARRHAAITLRLVQLRRARSDAPYVGMKGETCQCRVSRFSVDAQISEPPVCRLFCIRQN